MPVDDQNVESLAHMALEFQQQYDLDFVKIPVSLCRQLWSETRVPWDRAYLERVVAKVDDWNRIDL